MAEDEKKPPEETPKETPKKKSGPAPSQVNPNDAKNIDKINQGLKEGLQINDRVLKMLQRKINLQQDEVKLHIHPKCKKTIESLELQAYAEDGTPDKTQNLDHMADSLGYLIWKEFNPLHMHAGRGTGIRIY